MKSATSCFDRAVFTKSVLRFWPVWAIYAFVWLLILPLNLSGMLGAEGWEYINRDVLEAAAYSSIYICPVACCAAALTVFSHLYYERSAGFFAALPVKRGAMFRSLAAAGLAPLLAVNVLVFLVSLATEAVFGFYGAGALFEWLGAVTLMTVAYFGIAAFCAQLTGHIVVMPVLFITLGVAVGALGNMALVVPGMFCYGYVGVGAGYAELFSPFICFIDELYVEHAGQGVYELHGWACLVAYGLVGLALLPASMALYKRRGMESAGDVVAIASVKPVFRYICAFAAAFILGNLFYTLPFGDNPADGLGQALVYSACMAAGAFIGWFGAEMLLQKSYGVVGGAQRYIGWGVVSVLCCLFVVSCELDFTGYETRVPEAADVASVSVDASGGEAVFESPELISSVTALHQGVLDDRELNESAGRDGWSGITLRLSYEMKDGGELHRLYFVALKDTPVLEQLERLMNTREGIASRKKAPGALRASDIDYAAVSYRVEFAAEDESSEVLSLELTPEEAAELYNECILPDMREGHIGLVWYVSDEEFYESVYDCTIAMNINYAGKDAYFHTVPTVWSERTNEWLESHGVQLRTLAETGSENAP